MSGSRLLTSALVVVAVAAAVAAAADADGVSRRARVAAEEAR